MRAASCHHAGSRTVSGAFPSPACTSPLVLPLRAPPPRNHADRRPVQLCRRSGSPLRALPLDRPRRGAASRRTCAHLARRDRGATAGHLDALHATPGARFFPSQFPFNRTHAVTLWQIPRFVCYGTFRLLMQNNSLAHLNRMGSAVTLWPVCSL